MHVAIITHGLPQPNSNGGPMTCWAAMQALLASGHRVTVIALAYAGDPFNSAERCDVVRRAGAALRQVDVPPALFTPPAGIAAKLRQLVRPQVADMFPTAALTPRIATELADVKPDAIFAYHWDCLAMLPATSAPVLGVVGDPWHLPNLRRWETTRPELTKSYLAWTAQVWRDRWYAPRMMVALLNRCTRAGCFQKQEADWLVAAGARECEYFPSPIADPLAGRPLSVDTPHGDRRLRILLGPSNMAATSTSAGIRAFAETILPRLESALGADGFVVRIVGEGTPPAELTRLLPHPSIEMCGRIEPPDEEFLHADLQLVPTPFVLGIRLRIIVGFSFGCCVVADVSEQANIPEMVDGDNSRLGKGGAAVADAIIDMARRPSVRAEIGRRARVTYEREFRPEAAGQRIVRAIEQMAVKR